jgi:D-xylose 1-dehydrogenase
MTAVDPLAGFARYPSLDGRVAFVSGGATGLGAEFVTQLAAQGVHVAFVDIDRASGAALVESIAARGYVEPTFIECDVRDIPAFKSAISEAAARLGPVTILVNNAANDTRHRIEETDVELWDDRFAVNLRHYFFAIQAVAPMMREAGGGSIINLGSISAHIDLLNLPAYITAKAGIEGMTRTLARELGKGLIRVNCIIPGWIMTPRQLRDWVTPEAAASIDANQCLPHRLYPDDVARLMLWLAADDSRSCTGQNWIVDGGWIK